MNRIIKKLTDYITNQNNKFSDKAFDFIRKHPLIMLIVLFISIIILVIQNNVLQASIYFGVFIIYSSLFIFFRKQLKQDGPMDVDIFEIIYKLAGVFALIFLGTTYIFAAIGKYLIPNLLHFGSIDTWIQFAGSILSGSLTIIALAFTLGEQEKARKADILRNEKERKEQDAQRIEELEYRNPPTLQLFVNVKDKNEEYGMNTNNFHLYFTSDENFNLNLEFNLKNISSTSIAKINLVNIEVSKFNPFRDGLLNEQNYDILMNPVDLDDINQQFLEHELLPSQASIYFNLKYTLNKNIIAEINEFPEYFIQSKLKFQYMSTLLKKIYSVECIFDITVNNVKDSLHTVRINHPRNFYKLPKYEI